MKICEIMFYTECFDFLEVAIIHFLNFCRAIAVNWSRR